MDKIDRMILKAQQERKWQRLTQDNHYMEKTCWELLDMLALEPSGGCSAPSMRTPEWGRFIYALFYSDKGGLWEGGCSALTCLPDQEGTGRQPETEEKAMEKNEFMSAYEKLYGSGGG